MKYVVCYSGGHSSAICAVETVRRYGKENVILLNHDINPRSEDEDVKRFKREVADYLGLSITYANMEGWDKKDQFDVCIEERAFKYGIQSSALCTQKMKTEPFKKWLDENYPACKGEIRDDVTIVYGFDANESARITRRVGVMASMGYMTEFPLLWDNRTIYNIEEIGIKRPVVYDIFNHANCKGCLKAGKQHWFIIYCLYPEIWERAKMAEDEIGYSILRDKYLKELECDFALLKSKNFPETEKIKPQTFWAKARKLIADEENLPCNCSF
jgi:hypothetical protein